MKEQYIPLKLLRNGNEELLWSLISIIENFYEPGYTMTARTVYYQALGKNLIESGQKFYKKCVKLITYGRRAGLIDWDAIVDPTRVPRRPSFFDSFKDLVKAAIGSYRLDRWKNQDYYVEVFLEKEALAGVIQPLTNEYDIYLNVNRGYTSDPALRGAMLRFKQQQRMGKDCYFLYMGDHDPSGLNMVNDISNRFEMFGLEVNIERIALNRDQVAQYQLPPNFAKESDSRFKEYQKIHGNHSWELDALPPDVLDDILEENILKYYNPKKVDEIISKENEDKEQLRKFMEALS